MRGSGAHKGAEPVKQELKMAGSPHGVRGTKLGFSARATSGFVFVFVFYSLALPLVLLKQIKRVEFEVFCWWC